jgi:tetratricopeptide (TPR) repeat protein
MDAQIRRRRTLDAIKRVLLRESLNQPLMVMFEDLHWIDDETEAFLNLLADSIGTAKILLLVNYRPEYSHGWGNKTYYTQLRLDPLGRESADQMLAALLGDGAELAPLKRLIVDRTEGNPFFMEEMVQALFEDGALVRDGAARLTRPLDALRIPATVQAILASRIDRLPSAGKDVLETLAVIGSEFPLALAREVSGRPADELDQLLNQLQLAEFIYEQPAAGDVEYTFKHALTQEVAYNSVLMERRKALHERIGAALESLYADSLDDHVEQLAHHYRRSGNAAKAIDYLSRTAELAVIRNALNDAVAGYREALALLDGIADRAERERREASLQAALGAAMSMGNPAAPGVEEVYQRARELCERTGNRQELLSVLFGLRLAYNFRAELGKALELGEELIKMAPEGDPSWQLGVHASTSQTLFFLGEFSKAREHLRQVRGYRPPATPANSAVARTRLLSSEPRSRGAVILALVGFPDQAALESVEAIADAREVQLPLAYGLSELFCAQVFLCRRDLDQVRTHSEAALRLAGQQGHSQLGGYASALVGWTEALLGDPVKGIRTIREALEQLERVGSRIRTLQDVLLTECFMQTGDIAEGLATADGAIAHAQHTGERYCLAELHRRRGELLILNDDRKSAEAAFRRALEVARAQEARWWELRATVSFARLLRDTNRRDEARAMLAEIYNWFTEGFDTADLKDAKALLDELSG